jgi:GNAT superfamily N-acetyltransferase
MRTKIRQRNFYDWPMEVQKALWKLSLNDGSGIRDALRDIREVDTDHKSFVLFETYTSGDWYDDDIPVAWGLVVWDGRDSWDLMLYTRRNRRHLGYGRRVYERAIDWLDDEDYCTFPDGYNNGFFDKVDMR